jgi:hypothetical protein
MKANLKTKTPFTGGSASSARSFQAMDKDKDQFKHDPRKLCSALYDRAKFWWSIALLCRLGVFVISGLSVALSLISRQSPFLITGLAIVSELTLWYSDRFKNTADALLRKLDFRDSLGWPISKAEMSDLLAHSSTRLRVRLTLEGLGEQYFASAQDIGPKRALENLQESAWWNKHLAGRMGVYCLIATCVWIGGSIVILIASIETVKNFDTLSNIGRVVSSALALVFSLGLVRLTAGYYGFSRQAAHIEKHTEHLLDSGCDDKVQAIKVFHEYQLARATAPLIPSWVWSSMRANLNDLWKTYRRYPKVNGQGEVV